MTATTETGLRERYIELLEGALTHTLYRPIDTGQHPPRNVLTKTAYRLLAKRGIVPLRITDDPEETRRTGQDWPMFAHTMVGTERLANLRRCVETVLAEEVPGDLIETGVWRGGSSIFMRGLLEAHGDRDRRVWVCDSFEGLPAPDLDRFPQDEGGRWHEAERLAVSLEEVRANFARYGLLDDQVRFVKGFFADTLSHIEQDQFAVLRLDGDMYGSTMDALDALYPKLAPGGFCIVDDFAIPECRRAVEDYRRREGIDEPIVEVDWTGAYWRRSR